MKIDKTNTLLNPKVRVIPAKSRTHRNEENPDGGKKRIAAYARVSTLEESQNSSFELQVSYYKEYISKNPAWEFYKIYADEGLTGTSTKHRIGFNEMLKDAFDGKFDYIITKSISRFSRNVLDCIKTIRELKELTPAIGVYFEKENIDTLDSKSDLILIILASIAQEEAQSISQNVRWGIQKRFAAGIVHMPCKYFLGYDKDKEGNITIIEEEADIIRRIYQEFLLGKGTYTIAKELMQDGLLTARGNTTWTSDSVYKILTNEKMMGHCLTSKTYTVSYLTHERKRNDGSYPQYYVKNTHPAIISEDMWHTVQEELKRRSKMLRDPEGKYSSTYSNRSVFSNLFFCEKCGRPVIRRRIASTKNGNRYYFTAFHCRAAARKDPEKVICDAKYVRESALEQAFVNVLGGLKCTIPELIYEVKTLIEGYQLSDKEMKRYDVLFCEINTILEKIKDMTAGDTDVNGQIYDMRIRNLMSEQETLEVEFGYIRGKKEKGGYLEENLQVFIDFLNELDLEQGFDEDVFRGFVESGKIGDGHMVTYQFKCGIERVVFAGKGVLTMEKQR